MKRRLSAFITTTGKQLWCCFLKPIVGGVNSYRSKLLVRPTLPSRSNLLPSAIALFTASIVGCLGLANYEHSSNEIRVSSIKSSPKNHYYLFSKSMNVRTVQCEPLRKGDTVLAASLNDNAPKNDELLPFLDVLDPKKFRRMEVPTRGRATTHAVYGALSGPDMIERYKVFQNVQIPAAVVESDGWSLPTAHENDDEQIAVAAVVQLGGSLDGHDGIVHGGILALIIDDVLGFGYEAIKIPMAFTANLNVNYLTPVEAGSRILVLVSLTSLAGRKIQWKVQVIDFANGSKRVFCEATSLYIIPRRVSKM